jgi:PAS domain S-box-containing protein
MQETPLRLIIADDDLTHVNALRLALQSCAFALDIESVRTLRDFKKVSAKRKPDLAIVNATLPDGSADCLLSVPPENGPCPFIIMSTLHDEKLAVETLKAGALDFLVKSRETLSAMPRILARVLREWHLLQDKVRSEKAIHQAKLDWERTFDAVSDLICIIDSEGRILRSNRAMSERLHTRYQQLIGASCCQILHGKDVRPSTCPHRQTLADGAPHQWEDELEGIGGRFDINVFPLRDAAGKLIGAVHVARDITERKRTETERAHLKAQLNQKRTLEALGSLAAGISHDFNNILFGVMGYAELIRDCSVDPNTQHYGELIVSQCDRAADLVARIMTFSKSVVKKHAPIALPPIIQEVTRLLKNTFPKNIDVQLILTDPCRLIRGDVTQMNQVLLNLCTNARDAMAERGGTLEIRLDEVILNSEQVKQMLNVKPGRYVTLSVRDTGAGIAPEIMTKIFDPYFSTKAPGRGTGLGLATVQGIIQNHGGTITVESIVAQGTIFRMYFPALTTAKRKTTGTPRHLPATALTGTERIMIVDDETSVTHITEQGLGRLGYRVSSFNSSPRALAAFLEKPDDFDLIMTDQIMPTLSGLQLANQIHQSRPDIPIILCSGYTEITDATEFKAAQISVSIKKPLRYKDLAKTIRTVLDSKA